MKTLIATLMIGVFGLSGMIVSDSAEASSLYGTSNTIGGYTYHNFNNGLSGTSNTIGGYTYHNFNW